MAAGIPPFGILKFLPRSENFSLPPGGAERPTQLPDPMYICREKRWGTAPHQQNSAQNFRQIPIFLRSPRIILGGNVFFRTLPQTIFV